ncbi:hypothetical protein MM236_19600 [Belliella sp. DSM 107340]|uniref:Uncharacterized protein n=1 Tax=Belliella calami TaxID=2923436 RepID=A0ABS9UUC1_9BACT|nr:hypothetical protein [Belliella calami]MCH7399034.1 hypothetical protein [Belliella calami]MCH7400206.1 hypothetical protein [Belliella calami]
MKKKTFQFLIIVASFLLSLMIFNDWDDFKRGLKGERSLQKSENTN